MHDIDSRIHASIHCFRQIQQMPAAQPARNYHSRKPQFSTMALRRPPTRLELKADDITEYEEVRARVVQVCHIFCRFLAYLVLSFSNLLHVVFRCDRDGCSLLFRVPSGIVQPIVLFLWLLRRRCYDSHFFSISFIFSYGI